MFCKAGVSDEVGRESKSLVVINMLLVGRIVNVKVLCDGMKVVVNSEDASVDCIEGATVVEKLLITFVVVKTILGPFGDGDSIVEVSTVYIIG